MFSKATANFVHQIDPEGSLIHVSRVKNSHKLVPMALVVKSNRFWAWQKPRYHPTDFTLSDLLLGDEVLRPGLSYNDDLLSFKGTYRDKLSGSLETEAGSVGVNLEGRGSSTLRSCFGKLKMEELDIKKLLSDSRNRSVDMQHMLVKQIEKRAEVLAVVKDRILTTSSSSITQTKKQQCIFQGALGLLSLLGRSAKVCVKDSTNISMDSDVSLEIPSDTVIAYSVLELEIKKNGHFDICLRPGIIGGFEGDSVEESGSSDFPIDSIDGLCDENKIRKEEPSVAAQNGFHDTDLSPLADLPPSTRCDLFRDLQHTLEDRSALSHLQYVLEELCRCETVDVSEEEFDRLRKPPAPDQLGSDYVTEVGEGDVTTEMKSVHLLVSAMEELPDKTLKLLCQSRPDFLQAFDKMLSGLNESREPLSIHTLPVLLQDNQFYQQAEQLLSSIRVTLRRDAEELWVMKGRSESISMLVLSLSVRGLSQLCTGLL